MAPIAIGVANEKHSLSVGMNIFLMAHFISL